MTYKYSLQNGIVFVIAFLLQVFVLNNVNVYDRGFPMLYPIVILLIPVRQPAFIVLIIAFLTGLSIDFFTDTGGLHAAALTAMAFARIFLLIRLEPQANYNKEDRPGIQKFGWRWFAIYAITLLFIHHFFYFFIEQSSLVSILNVIVKTVCSLLLSFVLIFALNTFIFRS